MIATRDIGPGESLFTFPLTACVSQTNLKDQDLKVLMRGLLPFYGRRPRSPPRAR